MEYSLKPQCRLIETYPTIPRKIVAAMKPYAVTVKSVVPQMSFSLPQMPFQPPVYSYSQFYKPDAHSAYDALSPEQARPVPEDCGSSDTSVKEDNSSSPSATEIHDEQEEVSYTDKDLSSVYNYLKRKVYPDNC